MLHNVYLRQFPSNFTHTCYFNTSLNSIIKWQLKTLIVFCNEYPPNVQWIIILKKNKSSEASEGNIWLPHICSVSVTLFVSYVRRIMSEHLCWRVVGQKCPYRINYCVQLVQLFQWTRKAQHKPYTFTSSSADLIWQEMIDMEADGLTVVNQWYPSHSTAEWLPCAITEAVWIGMPHTRVTGKAAHCFKTTKLLNQAFLEILKNHTSVIMYMVYMIPYNILSVFLISWLWCSCDTVLSWRLRIK